MKNLIAVLLGVGAVLGLTAGTVYGLKDREWLVPPPETVVEGFTKSLGENRFGPALSYLTDDLRKSTGTAYLERKTRRLVGQTGELEDVQGEEGKIGNDRATAVAVATTQRAGERPLWYRLRFEKGGWKISELPKELR
jgi:hypothetical protein